MSGFKAVGWLLLLLFVGWLGFSISRYPVFRPAPTTLQSSNGFEGNTLLPASESQPHLDHARSRMLAINAHGQVFSLIDNIMAWASFLSTAAVTLILGYFGRRAPGAGAAANRSGLPQRSARLIGVLAALAAVLTAAGAMAKNQSRDDYRKADSARDYINAAVSDLAGSKSQQEARDALDQLDLEIGRL
jgi:hypothetical protein